MFNEDQVKKIKIFSTIANITNICFDTCYEVNDSVDSIKFDMKKDTKVNKDTNIINANNKLSKNEITCLKKCSESYLKLRDFNSVQLFHDYDNIKDKNANIYTNKT